MTDSNRTNLLSKLNEGLEIIDSITFDIMKDDNFINNNKFMAVMKYLSDICSRITLIHDILEKV